MPFARTRTFPSAAPPCPDAREKLFEKLLGLPGEGTGVRQGCERGGVRLGRAPTRSRWATGRRRRGRIELLRSVEVGLLGLIDDREQLATPDRPLGLLLELGGRHRADCTGCSIRARAQAAPRARAHASCSAVPVAAGPRRRWERGARIPAPAAAACRTIGRPTVARADPVRGAAGRRAADLRTPSARLARCAGSTVPRGPSPGDAWRARGQTAPGAASKAACPLRGRRRLAARHAPAPRAAAARRRRR